MVGLRLKKNCRFFLGDSDDDFTVPLPEGFVPSTKPETEADKIDASKETSSDDEEFVDFGEEVSYIIFTLRFYCLAFNRYHFPRNFRTLVGIVRWSLSIASLGSKNFFFHNILNASLVYLIN